MRARCVSLLLAAILAACDSGFDPRGTLPEAVVSIYGTLDSLAAEQRIRVEDVRATAQPIGEPASVSGVLVDDESGARQPGTVALVDDGAGGTARVLVFGDPIRQGRSYRLEVTRADGATASATTRIPPARAARIDAVTIDSTGRARQGVVFLSADARARQPQIDYRIVRPRAGSADTLVVTLDVPLRVSPVAGGVRVWVSPREDRADLLNHLGLPASQAGTLRVLDVTVRLEEPGPDGTRYGTENLVRAYGALAAVGRSETTFVPDARTVESAGLRL